MQLDRRIFLRGLAATGLLPSTACGEEELDERWLSAHGDSPARYGVALLAPGEQEAAVLHSGFRGHDLAQNPARPEQVVMFGRRPGRSALVLDALRLTRVRTFEPARGHSMMGHGFFSPDGARLYTTEADDVSGDGALVVRETNDWRVLERIATEGIGPHQAALMPDGTTAVIANGGILTRPESGREKLNLDTMRSTLTYLDLDRGRVLASETVAESKASIRHLEVAVDGTVALGLQLQREAMSHNDVVALAGVHRLGERIELFDQGLEIMGAMNDYVGSVAVCSSTRVAGFTSPRGSLAAFWDLDSGALLGSHALRDVCGITVSADARRFVLSSSTGVVRHLDSTTLEERIERRSDATGVRWDNHLITITPRGLER